MSIETNIAWCDSTWNWALGCDKVSPGCKNCYIPTTAPFRTIGMKHGDPRVRTGVGTFNAPLNWNKKPWVCDGCGRASPAHDNGAKPPYCHECESERFHRRRVFSLSLGDWLDKKIPISWLADAMQIMFQCQEIDFLLCSKRLENWRELMFTLWDDDHCKFGARPWIRDWLDGKAPKNIWIIGSAENQEMLEKRSLELSKIPAVVRGLSCEPLLGPLDFDKCHILPDWVIFGGESGPGARPCSTSWIREGLRHAHTRCFTKQLGSYCITENVNAEPGWEDAGSDFESGISFVGEGDGFARCRAHLQDKKGGDPAEWPEDLRVQEWPNSVPRPI